MMAFLVIVTTGTIPPLCAFCQWKHWYSDFLVVSLSYYFIWYIDHLLCLICCHWKELDCVQVYVVFFSFWIFPSFNIWWKKFRKLASKKTWKTILSLVKEIEKVIYVLSGNHVLLFIKIESRIYASTLSNGESPWCSLLCQPVWSPFFFHNMLSVAAL